MIDDLSDARIDIWPELYRNDWGHHCDEPGSAFDFLRNRLLADFPETRITFFVPYERHAVINDNGPPHCKYAVGEREAFTQFLRRLIEQGHEIAHHGSNHGRYIDPANPATFNNFLHEWELFDDVESGVAKTVAGIERFRETVGIEITGGKFCGYRYNEHSLEIIDRSGLRYWCIEPNFGQADHGWSRFGANGVLAFPTNFSGNSFVRLSYHTGDPKKDRIKRLTALAQPIYNLKMMHQLKQLYDDGQIISIQEHISPSTSSGRVQSANIVSDIDGLRKIFRWLSRHDIWHATCDEITDYIDRREAATLRIDGDTLSIRLTGGRYTTPGPLSITHHQPFHLEGGGQVHRSRPVRGHHLVDLPVSAGDNHFFIRLGSEG